MESNEVLAYTTKKLEEYSTVVLTASHSWDRELDYRVRIRDQKAKSTSVSYGVVFGLLFIINITVLLFSTNKNSDAKVVRQQDLKMLREELLIPNTL
jgi:hypothetical protein